MSKQKISAENLKAYLRLEIDDDILFENIPEGAKVIEYTESESKVSVTKEHIKLLLKMLLNGEISEQRANDWAETILLTFLFEIDGSNSLEHELMLEILYILENLENDPFTLVEDELRVLYDKL